MGRTKEATHDESITRYGAMSAGDASGEVNRWIWPFSSPTATR